MMAGKHMVALIAVLLSTSAAQAQDPVNVLKGKVQAGDHVVRLQRPATPALQSERPSADTENRRLKAVVDFGDFNFKASASKQQTRPDGITYKPESPVADTTEKAAPLLDADTQDDNLVIAWEEWHKRVCKAIFDNWTRISSVSGIAHTTITITRDHHISVDIKDVEINQALLDRMPRGMEAQGAERLREDFMRQIEETLQPLDGGIVLEFPSQSRRTVTSFHPYFSKDGDLDGYQWTKNDFERVHVR
jgi:hypothetical protein